MAYEPERKSGVLREIEQNLFLSMRITDKEKAKKFARELAWRWFSLQNR